MLTKLTARKFKFFADVENELGKRVVVVDPVGVREARPDRRVVRAGDSRRSLQVWRCEIDCQ
jgi:hypothetical protein